MSWTKRLSAARSTQCATTDDALVNATVSDALQPDLEMAAALFEQLDRATRQGPGIVRDSYGAGEQAAHDIMRAAAERIGLEVSIDAIGNLTLTLAGKDRSAPRILIGSHLDSVPQGGNFDGAAGVVAGLCALASLRSAGFVPHCDLGVIGAMILVRNDHGSHNAAEAMALEDFAVGTLALTRLLREFPF
jgi:acetylornithine deacetylase/succinyl-diaminopimelate desuccinylase-like protein